MAPDSDLSLIVEVLELVKEDGAADSLEKALKLVTLQPLYQSDAEWTVPVSFARDKRLTL